MSKLNEKILHMIDVRINDVIDWLQSCNSSEEKYEITRDAINFIEGILSMKEDCGLKVSETDDDRHNRLVNEVIVAFDKLKKRISKYTNYNRCSKQRYLLRSGKSRYI